MNFLDQLKKQVSDWESAAPFISEAKSVIAFLEAKAVNTIQSSEQKVEGLVEEIKEKL